ERKGLTYGRPAARYAASPCGPPLRNALTGVSPHRMTAIERNNQGIHARVISARECGLTAPEPPTANRESRLSAKSQTSFGRHTRMKSASATTHNNPPAMSTSSTPTKLLHRY